MGAAAAEERLATLLVLDDREWDQPAGRLERQPIEAVVEHAHERAGDEIDVDDAVVGHERRAIAVALSEHVGTIRFGGTADP